MRLDAHYRLMLAKKDRVPIGGNWEAPRQKGGFRFLPSRDGVRTRDLRRDGRGSQGRSARIGRPELGALPILCIAMALEFRSRLLLLVERLGGLHLFRCILARRLPPIQPCTIVCECSFVSLGALKLTN